MFCWCRKLQRIDFRHVLAEMPSLRAQMNAPLFSMIPSSFKFSETLPLKTTDGGRFPKVLLFFFPQNRSVVNQSTTIICCGINNGCSRITTSRTSLVAVSLGMFSGCSFVAVSVTECGRIYCLGRINTVRTLSLRSIQLFIPETITLDPSVSLLGQGIEIQNERPYTTKGIHVCLVKETNLFPCASRFVAERFDKVRKQPLIKKMSRKWKAFPA